MSGPSSPASIISVEEDIDGKTCNGLTLEGPRFGLEKIYDYESGGHHPIHLGDRLGKDGRYRVIHKLGNGGSANIWLCRDLGCKTLKYVGLKILMAEALTEDCRELYVLKLKKMRLDREVGGKYICLPLDHFQIDGLNGYHICFVYPVLGPRVSCVLKELENP
jgi:serine/threonine-protein kinase SRPK3